MIVEMVMAVIVGVVFFVMGVALMVLPFGIMVMAVVVMMRRLHIRQDDVAAGARDAVRGGLLCLDAVAFNAKLGQFRLQMIQGYPQIQIGAEDHVSADP